MKRGLVLSLCALALGAFAHAANAQDVPVPGSSVKVSLNLRYNDPADPTEGGKFYVVAQSANVGGFGGLAGLSVHISNIDGPNSIFGTVAENGYAASTRATLGDNLAAPGNSPYNVTSGGFVNLVYGQDLSTVGFVPVGTVAKGAGTNGNTPTDPLRNTAWNNSTVIFSGTFGAARPVFGGVTDANVFSSATAIGKAATITTTVRGDSMTTLNLENVAGSGLRPGDANRDGIVNGSDFSLMGANWQLAGGWGQGDFNDSGNVNGADFSLLGANWQQSSTVPAVAAVPEPATAVLLLAASFGVGLLARKR